MNALLRRIVCVPIVVLSVTAALSDEAAAKHRVPIKGTIQAIESSFALLPPDVPVPTLFVEATGGGRASHLGRFAVSYELQVNLNTYYGVGVSQFTAANGDILLTDAVGQGTVPAADGTSYIIEVHTITGGTGRFAGASGGFTVLRVINVFTGVTNGWFRGAIRFD